MNNALKKNMVISLVMLLVTVALTACGSKSSSSVSTTVPNSATIFYAHNLVFKNTTTILSTGYNGFGQLGTGSLGSRSIPAGLDKYYPFRGFAAGGNHSVAFTNNSSAVYSWGYNGFGQLGNESITYSPTPVRTGTITGVKAVAAGAFHSLALLNNDTLWAWGSNDVGQLGVDSVNTLSGYSWSPVKVSAAGVIFSNISAIAANGKHSLALADGKVWAWGLNGSGQLGIDQTKTGALASPAVVSFGSYSSRKTAIAAGAAFNFAVAKNGILLAWGNNDNGQLGNGTTVSSFIPVKVVTTSGDFPFPVVQAAAGIQHGLARLSDGSVWAWGYNFYGQLSNYNNSTSPKDSSYAVKVVMDVAGNPMTGASDIRAFGSSSMAKIGGVWYVWGENSYGQLGAGNVLKVTVPQPMSGF